MNPVQQALTALLRAYQWTLSPLLGNHCRFQPSCSQYMIDALAKQGTIGGLWSGTKRVCRCHPWCDGGYDPVP